MPEQKPQYGCFSLPTPPSNAFVTGIDSDGNPSRKRRLHGKSRYGCRNCKQRKVKCDEQQPCGHCVKRQDFCSLTPEKPLARHNQPLRKDFSAPASVSKGGLAIGETESQEVLPIPSIPMHISPINLQHMQLFYQFELQTYDTFIFEPQAWKETIISLALENTFVMQSLFLVTASHLQHLQSDDRRYRELIFEQLSQVLPNFRAALGHIPRTQQNYGDALMACSCLLLHYSWDSLPDSNSEDDGWENLLGLYSGICNIVYRFVELKYGGSRFTPWLLYSPKLRLKRFLKDEGASVPPDVKACFDHLLTCTEISSIPSSDMPDFSEAIQSLIILWSAIKMGASALETGGVYLDVGRYLFTWPNVHSCRNLDLADEQNGRTQAILLYYFAAIIRFHSKRFWWMQRRAKFMFNRIFRKLENKCEVCTGMAKMLKDEADS